MNDTARIDQAETDVIVESAEQRATQTMPTEPSDSGAGLPAGAMPADSMPVGVDAAVAAATAGGVGDDGMRKRSFYREAWHRVPRDLGYMLLTGVLLATLYWVFPATVFGGFSSTGAFGLVVIAVVVFSLYIARWLGSFEKLRIGWAEPRGILPVDWSPRWPQNGWTRLLSILVNPHAWLSLLHAVIVYPAVASVTVGLGGVLIAMFVGPIVAGVGALLTGWRINMWLAEVGFDQTLAWSLGAVACVVLMAAAVVLFPLWLRGSVLAHYWVDFGLLGGFRSELLQRRVVGLQESRAGIVTAEGQALRQIERDLHDGPQQRLVRLRMDLAAASRVLDSDPERSRVLIGEASTHAKDALDEIRALARGFAPPILLDRGLVAAIEALASRTPITVGLNLQLPQDVVLPTEVERNVYFTVSELLTNTTKHAGATSAGVFMAIVEDSAHRQVLTVGVTDDGRGGASPREGHGIAGLMGRMRALDGELTVSSPEGGPTEVTARIPLGALRGTPTAR